MQHNEDTYLVAALIDHLRSQLWPAVSAAQLKRCYCGAEDFQVVDIQQAYTVLAPFAAGCLRVGLHSPL